MKPAIVILIEVLGREMFWKQNIILTIFKNLYMPLTEKFFRYLR